MTTITRVLYYFTILFRGTTMKFYRSIILTLLIHLVTTVGYCQDVLDSALKMVGHSRVSFRVDPLFWQYRSGTEGRLPLFDRWFLEPARISFWEKQYRDYLFQQTKGLNDLRSLCVPMIGYGTVRTLLSPTPIDRMAEQSRTANSLAIALHQLDSTAQISTVFDLPPLLQEQIAMIIFAMDGFLKKREISFRNISSETLQSLYQTLERPVHSQFAEDLTEEQDLLNHYRLVDGMKSIDYFPFYAGVEDLTLAIERSIDTIKINLTKYKSVRWSCKTRFGWITINELPQDSIPMLLHLDFGNVQSYSRGGTTNGIDFPIGILMDFEGDDQYKSEFNNTFGTGILGFGLVSDLNGNDIYQSSGSNGQGAGIGGFGILLDGNGHDTYKFLGSGQGYGYYGVGILADLSGNDRYTCFIQAQGCGLPYGVGLLFDKSGDDFYTANDTDIQFPSAQTKEHNTSMAQGAGFGFRRDFMDGRSMAGGIGMLFDGSGNDTYFGGVFCQSVGYWYGIGILDDDQGDDSYRGVWYSQSATAHFGLSYLRNGHGNDRYESLMTMGIGAAHDYSVSIFEDESGNDTYLAQSNAVGRSLNSSIAYFVEHQGDDSYSKGASLGSCQNDSKVGLRSEMLTGSVFLELSGIDSFNDTLYNNHSTYIYPYSGVPRMMGIFMDIPNGKVKWR